MTDLRDNAAQVRLNHQLLAVQRRCSATSGTSTLPLDLALWITAAAVTGALLGSRLAGRVPPPTLRRAFGVLVLCVAAWMFVRSGWLGSLATGGGG